MRSNRRTAASNRGRSDGSFWLSFSDLMSSLVLIIILVLFYMIYQHINLKEINEAEIARRQYQLDQAQTELESQQTKLSDAEKTMIAQQILLDAQKAQLEDAQAVLDAQKTELANTQSQLSEKEAEIAAQQAQMEALGIKLDTQQAQITAQQTRLDNQQAQIEQLVGMKTRIITSLSEAFKNSNIEASVHPVDGSITLKSDVLFQSGEFGLSVQGEQFIDRFLPTYLDVLFSDEYKDYVAEVIVEGHTDSDGGYLENLKLSQQRALSVASYVLSDGYRGISGSEKRDLREKLTVNGRSYIDSIKDDNGRENKDASRRVVFKFRLTDEQMIQQLRDILETDNG